jgi:hypothetical protein
MAVTTSTPYNNAVAISQDYLGPAGERFMRRQIITHLNKEPELLTANDIPELVNWIRLTFALLTDNPQMIADFSNRLSHLTTPPGTAKGKIGAA